MNNFLFWALFPFICFSILFASLKIIGIFTFSQCNDICTDLHNITSKREIRFLQYNVFWRPFLLHIGHNEYIQQRSQLLSEKLDDYDIVCLNEAFHFGSFTVKNFITSMRSRGFNYVVSSRPVKLLSKRLIDSGVMILSKYPITETADITYSSGRSYDDFAAKGCVYAKIHVSESEFVSVFATHLQASYGAVTDADFEVRASQLRAINKFMRAHANSSSPMFLLGDMNIDSSGEGREYAQMIEELRIDGFELIDTLKASKGRHLATTSTLNQPGDKELLTNKSIDYVMMFKHKSDKMISGFSTGVKRFKVSNRPYRYLSDHFAVESTIELKE